MKDFLESIIDDKEITNWHILVLFITMDVAIIFAFNNYIVTRETYGYIFSNNYDINTLDNIYIVAKKMSFWAFLISPLILLLKVSIVTFIIQLFFMIRLEEVAFIKLFRIVLIGFGVILLSSIVHLIFLLLTPLEEFTLETITMLPFSISQFFTTKDFSSFILGIMNQVNLFELMWILLIGFGIKRITQMKSNHVSILVLSVWLVIFIFKAGVNIYIYKIIEN